MLADELFKRHTAARYPQGSSREMILHQKFAHEETAYALVARMYPAETEPSQYKIILLKKVKFPESTPRESDRIEKTMFEIIFLNFDFHTSSLLHNPNLPYWIPL